MQKRSSRTFLADLEPPGHGEGSGTRLQDSLDEETRTRLERMRRGEE